jgi:uncharacterized damage-inducible protein DinB
MTLDDVNVLFRFNDWANGILFDALAEIPEEPYLQDMKSSHGGIHGTATHLVGAEKVWLDRWRGDPQAKLIPASEVTSFPALRALWEEVRRQRKGFLETLTESKLQAKLELRTSRGETYTHPYWQTFQHLVNHSSYHRGQIVTLLRQIGVKPPPTDLIRFYREQPL